MTKTADGIAAVAHTYEYTGSNRPILSGIEGLTKADDRAYTWDANGNPSGWA